MAASTGQPLLGIDFDNTLVSYDRLFAEEAARLRLPVGGAASKREIRDRLRALPGEGERRWQELQATVYGPLLAAAPVMEGALDFLDRCRQLGITVCVVSHKTLFAASAPTGTDLRQAARRWLRQNGFLDAGRLDKNRIYFEDDRQAKVGRVRLLGCSHFIDDLVEVFADPCFPTQTKKILFAPGGAPVSFAGAVCRSWAEVGALLLNG